MACSLDMGDDSPLIPVPFVTCCYDIRCGAPGTHVGYLRSCSCTLVNWLQFSPWRSSSMWCHALPHHGDPLGMLTCCTWRHHSHFTASASHMRCSRWSRRHGYLFISHYRTLFIMTSSDIVYHVLLVAVIAHALSVTATRHISQ